MIHLSPRLAAVAALVPPGSAVIDVGTDHAMVPVWLVQRGIATAVLATDIRSGPLKSAAAQLEKTGTTDCIRLMQTDGLKDIGPQDGNVVILAGMGGETMISILSAAPWTREGALLILEPQSKRGDLRRWLIQNGYAIASERLVEDAGRIYPILTASGGKSPVYTEAELHLGRLEQIVRDPLFVRYLALVRARAANAAPYDQNAASLLAAYDDIQRRIEHGDCT